MDNHQYISKWNQQECLVAAGVYKSVTAFAGNGLIALQNFIDENPGQWLFGNLSYDLKNEIEDLHSLHVDQIGFPDVYFFIPQIVVKLHESKIVIDSFGDDHTLIFEEILHTRIGLASPVNENVNIQPVMQKQEYINIINQLKLHILRGDCYEINFCQEFYAIGSLSDPAGTYRALCDISPNPFSVFYKAGDSYVLCASPERYMMKTGNHVLSQPIKGTAPRRTNKDVDNEQIEYLKTSQKEKSENVMVVDLVRNDLSKICEEGTVKVDELYGIYSYPQVHQMMSTISGNLRSSVSFSDIIRATYPMGSMTGAPKKRVMELIEQYEHSNRGLFSGSVGYISPDGDFDFNVIIRSILYNHKKNYISYQVGSGITIYSDAEKEYEECILKGGAINEVLKSSLST